VTLSDVFTPPFDFLTFKTRDILKLEVNESGVIVSHVTTQEKREVIAFFALDCESINLGHRNLSEDELRPLLLSFSRGEFVRLKRMVLVLMPLLKSFLHFLTKLLQCGNGIRGTRAKLIGEGLKVCDCLRELNLVRH
jgi:hypothetical protein